jgi:hypothetical protein
MSLGDTIATTIIAGQRDVLSKCTDLYMRPHKIGTEPCNCDTANTLGVLKADLQHYHEAVTALARAGSKTTQLVRPPESCILLKGVCC